MTLAKPCEEWLRQVSKENMIHVRVKVDLELTVEGRKEKELSSTRVALNPIWMYHSSVSSAQHSK